ncbi:MAG: pyrroline-5-carboxylate reductase [Acidimicrobiales bacterium]|nr:pyrroline-5-carboxylate reductase [Acidimicrobiales bacterium]
MAARLVILGGGQMGAALLEGLLRKKTLEAPDVVVVEKVAERRRQLAKEHRGLRTEAEMVPAEGLVLAVKPDDAEAACRAAKTAGVRRVVSIVAGLPLARLEDWLGDEAAVVRAMPNTAALVGGAASALAPGRRAGDPELAWAAEILEAVGTVTRVPEELLDAVTGLSGSGPAYVFLLAEALIEGGVAAGLPRETSRALATQTLLGSARLLAETGTEPATLRAGVTSPGGTTAAALRVLENRGVRAAFLEAVLAATARSRELGGR